MDKIIIRNIQEIDRAARQLLQTIGQRRIIALRGEMGVGKTTLTTALMRALDMDDDASSPTFAIVNEYHSSRSRQTVYHFDFYRIRSVTEAIDIGVEDYWDSGNLCIMEWTENIESILPDDTLFIEIKELENHQREITICE